VAAAGLAEGLPAAALAAATGAAALSAAAAGAHRGHGRGALLAELGRVRPHALEHLHALLALAELLQVGLALRGRTGAVAGQLHARAFGQAITAFGDHPRAGV